MLKLFFILLIFAIMLTPIFVIIGSYTKLKRTHKIRLRIRNYLISKYNAPRDFDIGRKTALCTDGGDY